MTEEDPIEAHRRATLALADELERRGQEMLAKAKTLRAQAEQLDAEAAIRPLRERSQAGSVKADMHTAHRIAHSVGASSDPFYATLAQRKMTLADLSAKTGLTKSMISMYRRGKRPIPRLRAKQIERLTGWPADAWDKFAD